MSDRSYTQKVNEWLIANSGCTILDCCKNFGYYPIAVKIMGFDDEDRIQIQKALKADKALKELYLKYANDESANIRKGKRRNWTAFFQDMISGWVLEDLVIEMFRRQGIEIHHNGKDFKRIIDIGKEVSQESDCVITVGEETRKVELSNEFNTILEEKGYIEKRSPAIYNLWRNKVIWLYRELGSGKYVLLDFATEKAITHLRYHKNWDKDVHRYVLEENGKKVRSDRLLAAEMISVVGCSIKGKEQPDLVEMIDEDSPPHTWGVGGHKKPKNNQVTSPTMVEEKNTETEALSNKEVNKREKPQERKKVSSRPIPPPPPIEEDPDLMFDSSDDGGNGMIDYSSLPQEMDFL